MIIIFIIYYSLADEPVVIIFQMTHINLNLWKKKKDILIYHATDNIAFAVKTGSVLIYSRHSFSSTWNKWVPY